MRLWDELAVVDVHARLRRPVLVALVVLVVALVLLSDATVANLQRNEAIPRTRVSLLVGGAAATAFMLLLRPVLPEAERLAARRMPLVRLTSLTVFGCGFLAVGALASLVLAPEPSSAWRSVTSAAALLGIASAASCAGAWWGLVVPWLYLGTGLAFGFERGVDGAGGAVHPWAWLVGSNVDVTTELLTFAAGLAVAVLVRPRIDTD